MKSMSHTFKQGFTIVELLIVVVVIAILAAITIVNYNGIQARAKDSLRMNDLASIQKSLLAYDATHGGVPRVTTYYGEVSPYSGWDSSSDSKWLIFLKNEYGAIPKDPVNTRINANPPSSGNKVYYYYCYTDESYNPGPNPSAVIGYHKEDGAAVQKIIAVTSCL